MAHYIWENQDIATQMYENKQFDFVVINSLAQNKSLLENSSHYFAIFIIMRSAAYTSRVFFLHSNFEMVHMQQCMHLFLSLTVWLETSPTPSVPFQ